MATATWLTRIALPCGKGGKASGHRANASPRSRGDGGCLGDTSSCSLRSGQVERCHPFSLPSAMPSLLGPCVCFSRSTADARRSLLANDSNVVKWLVALPARLGPRRIARSAAYVSGHGSFWRSLVRALRLQGESVGSRVSLFGSSLCIRYTNSGIRQGVKCPCGNGQC